MPPSRYLRTLQRKYHYLPNSTILSLIVFATTILFVSFCVFIWFNGLSKAETKPTPYQNAKLEFLEKDKQVSNHCSEQYGKKLIQSWKRGNIEFCGSNLESSISCYRNKDENNNQTRGFCVATDTQIEIKQHHNTASHLWFLQSLKNSNRPTHPGCASIVNHSVFWLYRNDHQNAYHVLEDVVTALEILLVLDLDPIHLELVIGDTLPTNNSLFQIWSSIFGKGVRILNPNLLHPGTCFKNIIFSTYEGLSLMAKNSGASIGNTNCSSPILRGLRHFLAVPFGPAKIQMKKHRIGFISRRQEGFAHVITRVLPNEKEVLNYIRSRLPSDWELVIIRPELIGTFRKTVEIFRELTVLIGAHGAGLANIIYMGSGTHLIEIWLPGKGPWWNRHYFNMCKWLGIQYHTVGSYTSDVDPTPLWDTIEEIIFASPNIISQWSNLLL